MDAASQLLPDVPLTDAQPTRAPPAPTSPAMPTASPTMDREFIERNQIVERYLAGRLPPRGALEFERFCAQHPDLLDSIGLPARVHAGLRLLEAGGKPEPWAEKKRPVWEKPPVLISFAAFAVVLLVAILEAAQPRYKLETNKVAKRKTYVADPAGIDIVRFDGEIAAVIEQSVENIDGLARIGVHGDDVESAVLVRRKAVKFGAGVGAVPRVEIANRLGMASRRKILSV